MNIKDNKKSFVLYTSYHSKIKKLSLVQKGELLDMIFSYAVGEPIETDDLIVDMAFSFIQEDMILNYQKWEIIKQKRSDAGKQGGRGNTKANALDKNQNKTNENKSNQDKANKAVDVICNMQYDNVNENEICNMKNVNDKTHLSASACKKIISEYHGLNSDEIQSLYDWIDHKYDNKKEKYKERGLKNVLSQCLSESNNNRDICVVISKSITGGVDGMGWSGIGFEHVKFTAKIGSNDTLNDAKRQKYRATILAQCQDMNYIDATQKLYKFKDGTYDPKFNPLDKLEDMITKKDCQKYEINYPTQTNVKQFRNSFMEDLLKSGFIKEDFTNE